MKEQLQQLSKNVLQCKRSSPRHFYIELTRKMPRIYQIQLEEFCRLLEQLASGPCPTASLISGREHILSKTFLTKKLMKYGQRSTSRSCILASMIELFTLGVHVEKPNWFILSGSGSEGFNSGLTFCFLMNSVM